jgi:hypothetical protein
LDKRAAIGIAEAPPQVRSTLLTHFLFNGNAGIAKSKNSESEHIISSILAVMTPTRLADGDRLFPLDENVKADSFVENPSQTVSMKKYNKECVNTCYVISEGVLKTPNGTVFSTTKNLVCINPLALVTAAVEDINEQIRELRAEGTCVVWGLKVKTTLFFFLSLR